MMKILSNKKGDFLGLSMPTITSTLGATGAGLKSLLVILALAFLANASKIAWMPLLWPVLIVLGILFLLIGVPALILIFSHSTLIIFLIGLFIIIKFARG